MRLPLLLALAVLVSGCAAPAADEPPRSEDSDATTDRSNSRPAAGETASPYAANRGDTTSQGTTATTSSPSTTSSQGKVPAKERILYVEEPPAIPGMSMQDAHAATKRGILAWDGYDGWNVELTTNQESMTMYAEFVKEWGGDRLGVAFGTAYGPLQIGLGDSACNGKWTPFDAKTIEAIATHEMGHGLGLDHSSDRSSIMYPTIARKSYAAPCEIASGSASVGAGSTSRLTFQLTTPATVTYDFAEGADGTFDLCLYDAYADLGCTGTSYAVRDTIQLDAGRYAFDMTCENWIDTCALTYELTWR